MSTDAAVARNLPKCDLCGYPMPDGTCQRQACKAARLHWAKRKASEQAADSTTERND